MKTHIVLIAAALGLVGAVPHRHHAHVHEKRNPTPVADTDYVAGPTVIMYSLNGIIISEAEVLEGIANGTLIWANGAPAEASSDSSTTTAAATSTSVQLTTSLTSSSEAAATSSSESSTETTSYSAASSTSSSDSSASTTSSSSTSSGLGTTFPDGEISCSEFPSAYGAVSLSYLGLGGWTGIQSPGSETLDGFLDIETITESTCSGTGCCSDGMYCSYACPAGYQKSQWPTTQGSTGQSVGGLLCKSGKLYKTNDDYDDLCITGTSAVTVLIKNEMSNNAAVCRTDYPGTESETVPLNVLGGETANLTCPDEASYYKWGSDSTSAQYYVNPAGVDVEDACTWGSSDQDYGNYAPLNIGVGYSDDTAWLAIFQNSPTTDAKLAYTVTLEGDNMSGKCRYSNGEYCSGDDYSDCSTTTGCTVSVTSGTAYFVFSSS